MHGPCMVSHAWLIHDSCVLLFTVYFLSYFKIVFILQGDYPVFVIFFVFDRIFLLICSLFLLISLKIIFVQKSNRRRHKKNIWELILLTLSSLSQKILCEECQKEYFHKTLCSRTEIDEPFCNLFMTCIQHVKNLFIQKLSLYKTFLKSS